MGSLEFGGIQMKESWKIAVEQQIEKAKKNAIDSKNFDYLTKRLDEIASMDDGEITDAHMAQFTAMKNDYDNATFQVKTFSEYRYALEQIGISKENQDELIAHENAHVNVGEQLGAEIGGYRGTVLKEGPNYIVVPNAMVFPNENQPQAKVQADYLRIANAPEEYGNSLSQFDQQKINKHK